MSSRQVGYTLPDALLKKIKGHCEKQSAELGESPGFVFRRCVFGLCSLLDAGASLSELRNGLDLLAELKCSNNCSILSTDRKELLLKLKEHLDSGEKN